MVGDPKECRDNAQRCIEMANRSKDTKTQTMLFDMAAVWTKLAADIERSEVARKQSKTKPTK